MAPLQLPRPGLVLGLLLLLSLAVLPSAAAPPANGNPCTGVIKTQNGAESTLTCNPTGCVNVCEVVTTLPPPGSATVVSSCACPPQGPGDCCRITLVKEDGGVSYPLVTGFCGIALECGLGRCALVVVLDPDMGASTQTAKCLPWG